MESSSMARFESLLKWINSFDGIKCDSFKDLTSGQILLECLHRIMPDIVVPIMKDPWKEIFSIFEEFCGCTLEKAVSAEQIALGDQEHISRVVVLLLSVAVQSKNNEVIIGAITSLDYEAQRDIMFFIESTLAKVKSHAIVAGTFTSGVGEPLPNLDTSASPTCISQNQLSPNRGNSLNVLQETSNDDCCFRTPHRPPSRALFQTGSFYNGLDSTAGAKLLMSPAITGCKRSYSLDSPKSPDQPDSTEKEEISRLKHSIRVLKGTLQVEKALAQEYYAELCGKIQECEELKTGQSQLERRLEYLKDMGDVQDELAHTTRSLAAAEKSIMSYKSRIESLEGYKERSTELEAMMSTYEAKVAVCEEYQLSLGRLEKLVLEKTSGMKHLELELNKATIEAAAKSAHVESLLEENREHKRELGESRNKCRQLEEDINQLELKLTGKNDNEATLQQDKQEMEVELEQLQASLESSRKEVSELKATLLEDKTSMAACSRVKDELQSELTSKVSEIASVGVKVQSLETTKEDLETQVTQLKSSLKTLQATATSKQTSLQQEISDKNAALSAKEAMVKALDSRTKELDNQISQLKTRINTLEQDMSTKETDLMSTQMELKLLQVNSTDLESQISHLQSINRTREHEKATEISAKDQQIESLENIELELEAKLTECQSKFRSLEQDIATKNTEMMSKDQQFKSLEDTKTELELLVTQTQNKNKLLEQEIATKVAEMSTLQGTRKVLESETMEQQQNMKALKQANMDLKAELSTKIARLGCAEKELEAQLLELKSVNSRLEKDVSSKVAELAISSAKISNLTDTRDSLAADLDATQKELLSSRARGSVIESEVSSKEGLLATLTGKCAEFEGRVAQLTEQIVDQRSSLQSASDLAASLSDQNKDLESRCAQLEAQLREKDKVNQFNETLLSKYKSDLETSKRLLAEYKQHTPTFLMNDEQQIQTLIRENLLLQSQQTKFWEDYDEIAQREQTAASHCQELEASLAVEKTKFRNLRSSLEGGASITLTPEVGSFSECSGTSSTHHTVVLSGTKDTGSAVDEVARVKELKRRNKQAPPHLKSSYPIEMQVKPETPTCSDTRLKYGKGRKLRSSTLTLEQLDCRDLTPTTSSIPAPTQPPLTSSSAGTMLSGDAHSQTHSAPNPRRLSAPPTPEPYSNYKRKPLAMQKSTICPSLNLRDFLDNPSTSGETVQPSSTAFEVAFSPPKVKGALPKRLQENKNRRNKSVKETNEGGDGGIRRETVCKKKGGAEGTSNKSRGRGKKWLLRPRNN